MWLFVQCYKSPPPSLASLSLGLVLLMKLIIRIKSDFCFYRQLSGCQVACGFFESLLLKMSNEPESLVVATKRANVLQISSGKMAWPQEEEMKSMKNKNNNHQIPLVYVLIQEYPDLKWRQITQVKLLLSFLVCRNLHTRLINWLYAKCQPIVHLPTDDRHLRGDLKEPVIPNAT